MNRLPRLKLVRGRPGLGLAVGLAGTAVSYGMRLLLGDVAFQFPFIIFFPPVILATFFGGFAPGVAIAVLAGLVVDWSLIPPLGSLKLAWPNGWLAMTFYAVAVGIDVLIVQMMRVAFARAEDAERDLLRLNATLERRVAERTALLEQQEHERATAEGQVRQLQKMEAMGQLTGGVAHDFNNLLTIIKSSAELLTRPNLPDERRVRYVQAISETADRAARLTQQLLAFARRQPLVPTLFAVDDKVAGVLSMLQTVVGGGVEIRFAPGGRNDLVDADANQFETALVNMAVNARDARPRGGTVSISVERADAIPATRNHIAAPGEFVVLVVSDSGTGMDADTLTRIFEPFYTTKEVGKGTGLGLSQVYGFAKQSSGEIVADSTQGIGTTFRLYLPRATTLLPADGAPPPDGALAETAHGGCVLIVEDNRLVGEFATQLLEDLGFDTVWAPNAQAALERLEANPDAFDVVFTDVVMPGMSGVDLALELRRTRPDLPVVLTSGYSQVLATEGTHGFELLQKPYSATKIVAVLHKVAPRAGRVPARA